MAKAAAVRPGAESTPDSVTAATRAVLGIALDELSVPALVVGARDQVICSNAAARASSDGVRWPPAPVAANRTGRPEPTWVITPLDGPGWSLVIWRTPDTSLRRRWRLTRRQMEVLELVTRGMTNIAIAQTLGIRAGTVEFHVSAIFDKVGVNSRAALIANVMGG